MATLMAAVPVAADTSNDKQQVDRNLAQTQAQLESVTDRARQAVTELNQANAALPAAQAVFADARGRVVAAQAASRQADRRAAAARAAAETASGEYRRAADAVDRARGEVSTFVAASYRGSGFTMLNTLLEAGSPSDLADRIGYLDHVADAQRQALTDLTESRLKARARSDAADATRQRADRLADAAAGSLRDALAAQASAESAASSVQSLVDQKTKAANAAEQERGAVLGQYQQLREHSDQLAAALREADAQRRNGSGGGNSGGGDPGGGNPGEDPPPAGGGRLRKPVDGWKSSDFGMRYDPYYHVWQLHAGVDFAAPGGTPIYAAGDGEVIRTGWYGGYGNYTCIYHGVVSGRGLSTCYAHQSEILVSSGQHVDAGQLIGRVGTTGASTGCHLHFEVRLDGVPVQPLEWL